MGFDTDLFVEQPVKKDFLCDICYSVQERPTTVCMDGHTFCEDCVNTWNNNCPQCRQPALQEKPLCRVLQSNIMGLMVRCPREMETKVVVEVQGPETRARKRKQPTKDTRNVSTVQCEWEGSLSRYLEKHRHHECPLRMVQCPYHCGREMRACNLASHKDTECKYRVVECEYCSSRMEQWKLYFHLKEPVQHSKQQQIRVCPKLPVSLL